jgi:hypothetical protein
MPRAAIRSLEACCSTAGIIARINACISILDRCMPTHAWAPKPHPRWAPLRCNEKASGCSNWVSSILADAYSNTTRWPLRRMAPSIPVSCLTIRVKPRTGEPRRTASTAAAATRSGLFRSSSHTSGLVPRLHSSCADARIVVSRLGPMKSITMALASARLNAPSRPAARIESAHPSGLTLPGRMDRA